MIESKKLSVNNVQVDEMLLSLLDGCYGIQFADVSSHFYQLIVQTLQTNPNIVGPLKPPTGKTIINRVNGKRYPITKKVDQPQKVDVSIWVVRGFYPETGIPFKMTLWQNSLYMGAKVSVGSFPERTKFAYINCDAVKKYVEEVAEKTLLDQPIDETIKPVAKSRTYKCMSPEGLPLQKKKSKKR